MSTIKSKNDANSAVRAVVQQYNALHEATIAASTDGYHRDISSVPAAGDWEVPASTNLQVTAASAVDLPTSLLSVLNLQGVLGNHMPDDHAHLKADIANCGATPFVPNDGYFDGYAIDNTNATTQLASALLMVNAEKKNYNAHLTQSGVHRKSDTANSVATADATDLPSLETLANALKTAVNAHIISGPTVGRVRLKS